MAKEKKTVLIHKMIDYNKIASAIKYYRKIGYTYSEIPWFEHKLTIDVPGMYVYCFPYVQENTNFLKVELLHINPYFKYAMQWDSFHFFKKYTIPKIIQTNQECKITIKEIEIGSYSYKETENKKFAIGTGIIEPLFSKILNKES